MTSQITVEAPPVATPMAKCSMCPHKDTWVGCICKYELHNQGPADVDEGS